MQDTATKSESVANQLKDKKLFREACYVDGAWIQAKSGGAVQVDNPATGEIIGSVPKLGAAEARDAIEAAKRAFSSWSKKTGKERAVVLRHALRNAAVPVLTVLGLQVGTLLGGAVITESVFAWPGMGKLVVDAIFFRDFPVVQTVLIFSATIFVLINLLVDLLYTVIDPRIRYS